MNLHNPACRALLGASLALAALFAACGGSDDTSTSTTPPPPPPATASFTLALSTQKALIEQGHSVTLTATITRDAGFTDAVELSLSGLPAGVSAAPATIAQGSDSAQITLSADTAAPHSLPTDATARGNAGTQSAQQAVTVTVRGPAGSLDTSFAGGTMVTPVGASEDYAEAMAVQADGRVVVAGHTASTQSTDFAVVRYLRDGGLDTGFGGTGKVVTAVGAATDQAFAVAIQGDGKILVAGSTDQAGSGLDFALVRYNADGSLDSGFGNAGKVVTSFGTGSDRAYAIAVQADGKIVLGGDTSSAATGVDFALARYNADGSLDASFGSAGKVVAPLVSGSARDSIYALALQTLNGQAHIVAVGGEGDFAAARFTPSGALDTSFGTGGKVTGLFGSVIGAARGVVVTADNKLVLAGGIGNDFALARLTENGLPDSGFGTGGKVVSAVSSTNWDSTTALARQSDGKLVLGGWAYAGNSSSADFVLQRYSADGVLDAGFGNAGTVIRPVAPGTKNDAARAVALQVDERIPTVRSLLAGSANDSNHDFVVTRFWN